MDKVIREIQGANEVLTCGQKVLSKLDFRLNNLVEREKIKERKKGVKKKATFSLGFPTMDRRFSADQEEKSFPAQRVSSRDRKRGDSKNSKR